MPREPGPTRTSLSHHPAGGDAPLSKATVLSSRGYRPRTKPSLLIPMADSWFSTTVIPHTSSTPPHSVAVFSWMTLEKSDVFSQIRNDPKEEQGHTPSKECCLYAAIFQCAWMGPYVQVDPHVHVHCAGWSARAHTCMWSRFMVLFIAASLTHSETLEKLRKVTESYGKLRKVTKMQKFFKR